MADSIRHVSVSVLITLVVFIICPKECFSQLRTPVISGNLSQCIFPKGGFGLTRKVGLTNCLPRKLIAEWIFKEGCLHWASDPKQCLVPNCKGQSVGVKKCGKNYGQWKKGKGCSIFNSLCDKLVLSVKGQEVGLAQKGGSKYQSWFLMDDLKENLKKAKVAKYPEKNKGPFYRHEMMKSLANAYTPMKETLPYPRSVDSFPGAVKPSARKVPRTINLTKSWKGQSKVMQSVPEWWQPTDVYAVAGDTIEVNVPKKKSLEGLILRVGAQSDILTDESPTAKQTFHRMPIVSEEYLLLPGTNKLRSQYGGSLIFKLLGPKKLTGKVNVSNVVEAPYFLMGSTSVAKWKSLRQRDAPQTVLVGSKCVLVVPSRNAKNLDDPMNLLKGYDKVINLANTLANFAKDDPPPPGRFWLVSDIQVVNGKSHSGFPIVFDRSYDLVNNATPKNWDIWREVGENYRQFCWSSCKDRTTGDLYALFMEEKLTNSSKVNKTLLDKAQERLKKGYTFDNVSEEERLVFFTEIKDQSNPKGWHPFQELHKRIRTKKLDFQNTSVAKRRDLIYYILSDAARTDLHSIFCKWGLNISKPMRDKLARQLLKKGKRSSASCNLFSFLYIFVCILFIAFCIEFM